MPMRTQIEQARALLARQVSVGAQLQCYMQGRRPTYSRQNAHTGCGAARVLYYVPRGASPLDPNRSARSAPGYPQPVNAPNIWAPNNRGLGIVQGWSSEQIRNEWRYEISNRDADSIWVQLGANFIGPMVPNPELVNDGLWVPDDWHRITGSQRRQNLATWFLYALNLEAQARTRIYLAELEAQSAPAVGGGGQTRSAQRAAAQQAQQSAAIEAHWDAYRQQNQAAGGVWQAPSWRSNGAAGGGRTNMPDPTTGGMGADLTPRTGGGGGTAAARPASYGAALGASINVNAQADLQRAVQGAAWQDAVWKAANGKDEGGGDNSGGGQDAGNDGDAGGGDLIPAPPSSELGLADTQNLARRVLATPAGVNETARRIVQDQSRVDLQRALLVGAAGMPAFQGWAGEAWRTELVSAMGRTAYDLAGGDWGALLGAFASIGTSQAQYMAWIMAVVERVRTQVQAGPAKKKGGGGGLALAGITLLAIGSYFVSKKG